MIGTWNHLVAACLMAGCAMGEEKKDDRIQLRAQDGKIVAVIISGEEKSEIIAETIEIVEDAEVTAQITLLADGNVAICPPTPVSPPVRLGVTTELVPTPLARQLAIDTSTALMISSVQKGLAAQKAGLSAYDVIVKLDGKPVTQNLLQTRVKECEVGETIKLSVIRQGKPIEVEVIAEVDAMAALAVKPQASRALVDLTETPRASVPLLSGIPVINRQYTTAQVDTTRRLPILLYDATLNTQTLPLVNTATGEYIAQTERLPTLNIATGEYVDRLTTRLPTPSPLTLPTLSRYLESPADASMTVALRKELEVLKEQIARIELIIEQSELAEKQ